MFRDACDVRLRSETFSAGICQALFNSSKNLCTLEGAGEDEIQVYRFVLHVSSFVFNRSKVYESQNYRLTYKINLFCQNMFFCFLKSQLPLDVRFLYTKYTIFFS